MAPPGAPVRAEQAKAQLQQMYQQQQQQQPRSSVDSPRSFPPRPNHPQPHSPAQKGNHSTPSSSSSQPGSHHRSSMPNPHLTGADHSRPSNAKRLPKPAHASTISSRPSLNSSDSSGDSSLRETSKANIRGSMPPPRHPSGTTLSWDQSQAKSPSPKESWLETPRMGMDQHSPHVHMRNDVEMQFDHLLDSLQVPETVRQKFSSVSQDVKSSILTSTLNSNPTILSSLGLPVPASVKETPKMRKKLSTPLLRKAKSSAELNSPGSSPQVGKTYSVEGEGFVIVASPVSSPNPNRGAMSPPLGFTSTVGPGATPSRGQSMDLPRPATTRQSAGPSSNGRPLSLALFGPSSSNGSVTSLGKAGGKGLGIAMGEQPEQFIQWLGSYKGTDLKMDVARAKKLRMLLRHESTDWITAFIDQGGYKLVLDRLQDLLDIEWREEQHDDQMLYELLRCIKAMSTSEIGKIALRAHFPQPFPALSQLLFSEKKPGDLASRQIIVELWLFLFDLFPPMSLSQNSTQTPSASASGSRPTSVRFDEKAAATLRANSGSSGPVDIVKEIRGLLVPDLPDPTKEHHEFVTKAHRPRVFKAWVGELSDICRDYFWIMCHASNALWNLDEVDDSLVERPVAPGGATGGVEFEAMNYVTMHFKLLNALCKYQAMENKEAAKHLHGDLMSSGMDRILVTLRKASTTYYPTLHLELARYVDLLGASSPAGDKKLPYLIGKMVGPPPEEVRKFDYRAGAGAGRGWTGMPATGGRTPGRS
ncbi:hypothetical protein I317_03362 [Kwoniella heveanensis CBS 569]|nr:hypothetical protein I317_03362 [Kwoniella heveanensis CBS 569]